MRLIDADALKADLIEFKEKQWQIYNGLNHHIDKKICGGQISSFTEAILRIKDAPTIDPAQQWIPVTERLPENEQDVLITVRREHYCKPGEYIRFVVKAFYTDGKHDTEHSAYTWFDDMEYDEESDAYKIPEGWWESIEYGEEFQAVGDSVTHWMPLPEPPKDGGADHED